MKKTSIAKESILLLYYTILYYIILYYTILYNTGNSRVPYAVEDLSVWLFKLIRHHQWSKAYYWLTI